MEFSSVVSVGERPVDQVLRGRWMCDSTGALRLRWQVADREGELVPEGLGRPVAQFTPVLDTAAAA